MKIYVVLIFSFIALAILLTKSNAEDSSENNSSVKYDECNSDDWFFTNATIKWVNDTKNIIIICQSNELSKNGTYKTNIVISDCKNHMNCNGKLKIMVNNYDCDGGNLLAELKEPCRAAKEAGKLEKQCEWLSQNKQGAELFTNVVCININDQENEDT